MNPHAASVSVRRVPFEDRDRLTEMLIAYLAELGAPQDYPYLDLYWREDGRVPYWLEAGGTIVGFALVRVTGHGVHEMAEFCVRPSSRGRSIGRAAAAAVFSAHPGPWRVPSFPGRPAAEAFWRKAVPADAQETRDGAQWVHSFVALRQAGT